MLGKPKYKKRDEVSFLIEGEVISGTIEIVDAWGTFFHQDQPYYDVMVPEYRGTPTLVKHVGENNIWKKDEK